jgi:hypothetical protein
MRKRGLIVLLAGVNLLLLGAVVFTVYTPPSALAQAVGARRGEFLLLSARAESTNDAIYMIDAGARKVHVFRSIFPRLNNATDVGWVSTRDLTRDFAGPAGPGAGAAPGGAGQPVPGQQPGGAGVLPLPGGQQP